MKKCPYCAEQIQDEAIVCRYCGRDLVNKPVQAPTPTPVPVTVSVTAPPQKKTSVPLIMLSLVAVVCLGCFAFLMLGALVSPSQNTVKKDPVSAKTSPTKTSAPREMLDLDL